MKLRFMGTGTSFGIPVLGCDCRVCRSGDPRDRRTRHSALIELDGGRLLVDTPPEIRLQLLEAGPGPVDAVWYTHAHADHIHGIDDLRAYTALRSHPVEVFVPQGSAPLFRQRFSYIFDKSVRPEAGTSKPTLDLIELDPDEPVSICGSEFRPLPVPHGPLTVFGFRVGALGYITDAKRLPTIVKERLAGVRVLVLNALWLGNPHPTHFNVEEAVSAASEIGAERTYLTHLTHRVSHEQLLDYLPEGIEPAYDGLDVEIP